MTEAKRKALRAEAKAWRKMAEWVSVNEGMLCSLFIGWSVGGESWQWRAVAPFRAAWKRMLNRITPMADASVVPSSVWYSCSALDVPDPNSDARVIFCLLMALVCEEEARGR